MLHQPSLSLISSSILRGALLKEAQTSNAFFMGDSQRRAYHQECANDTYSVSETFNFDVRSLPVSIASSNHKAKGERYVSEKSLSEYITYTVHQQ